MEIGKNCTVLAKPMGDPIERTPKSALRIAVWVFFLILAARKWTGIGKRARNAIYSAF